MRARLTILTTLATAALTAAGLAAPAAAEVTVVHDKAGDGSNGTGAGGARKYGDIGRVRVAHRPHSVRLVVHPAKGGQLADFYDFWVDTRAKDPGPEFVASVSLEVVPRAGAARAESFGDLGGRATCSVRTARVRGRGIEVVLPRTCFDRPDRLRVSTQTSMEYENADWAPGRRHFGPWVHRG